jgi:hypothetical protein
MNVEYYFSLVSYNKCRRLNLKVLESTVVASYHHPLAVLTSAFATMIWTLLSYLLFFTTVTQATIQRYELELTNRFVSPDGSNRRWLK